MLENHPTSQTPIIVENLESLDPTPSSCFSKTVLDYKTILFEYLVPHVKRLQNKDSNNDNSELKKISQLFPLCKDFMIQLSNNNLLQWMFLKVTEEMLGKNYSNAIFFADKMISMSDHAPVAVYLLGEALFSDYQMTKVNYLFHKSNLLLVNENFRDLSARSFYSLEKFDQCLKVLSAPLKTSLYSSESKYFSYQYKKYFNHNQIYLFYFFI